PLHDVGVFENATEPGFAIKSPDEFRLPSEVIGEQFQRDRSVGIDVVALVNRAHSAFANFAKQTKSGDRAWGTFVRCRPVGAVGVAVRLRHRSTSPCGTRSDQDIRGNPTASELAAPSSAQSSHIRGERMGARPNNTRPWSDSVSIETDFESFAL